MTAPIVEQLRAAGFVAAEHEAAELVEAASGDTARLAELVERRLRGEPLAWITGRTTFCGCEVHVDTGVYVPRWHTEALVARAVERLPPEGAAVDVCCGAGAIAVALSKARPLARVVACDVDERAVACAIGNGVEAYRGDVLDALPTDLSGRVDVVVGSVPYVPTPALALLHRDTLAFEPPLFYDGGDDGTDVLRRVVAESPAFLRPGGALFLELGGDQPALLAPVLAAHGFVDVRVLLDDEGDPRGVEATLAGDYRE